MVATALAIPQEDLARLCRRNRIRRLFLFGSVLRDDFTPDSDLDVLVEFDAEARIGLVKFAGIEMELSDLFGRKVDLCTPGFLSPHIRERILREADLRYDGA